MSFILKIVEGPNRGAEIALVEGVAVTLGKGDECDIVLADSTLPEEPLSIEANGDAVSVNGEQLEQFAVKTLGATSFAVGPADAPWGELKWPAKGEISRKDAEPQGKETQAEEAHGEEDLRDSATPREEKADAPEPEKKKHGCLGCLVVLVLLVLLLGVLAWLFRATVRPYAEKVLAYARESLHVGGGTGGAGMGAALPMTLSEVASSYGLELEENDGQAKLSGNLKTRAERLRATAEAYEARPGVDLDLSDDESFRASADDALFTITEGAIKVVAATNRVLSIAGTSSSPFALKRILESLNTDLPKLRDIDATGVAYGMVPGNEKSEEGDGDDGETPIGVFHARRRTSKAKEPSLPVCGILTAPYPCLVMRDGSRVLEGAALGGNVIVKIEADAVTVTNATGRFTWKP
ncbi:MAG: hypothetical protein J6Q49_05605 [Kiritimatiellae bacterium]|nr:hypothetical protein [Kiritimatiellia bacterium]